MAAVTDIVWKGAEPLAELLVAVDEVRTHPRNPRKGNVAEIAKSLDRWGQVRAVLLEPDGTIVAGNHTYLAARHLGWTHVAAVRNEFASAEEARAYLLADNRLGDAGENDRAELMLFLQDLEQADGWKGTGYEQDDLEHLRELERLAQAPPAVPEPATALPPQTDPPPAMREVVLLFDEEKLAEVSGNLRVLRQRYGLEGVTDTVLRAVKEEAMRLHQAEA